MRRTPWNVPPIVILTVGMFGVAVPDQSLAQNEVVVLTEPTAEVQDLYAIGLSRVAVLGTLDGDGAIVKTTVLRRTQSGHYLVGQGDHIKVFDGNGRFVRTLGRRGSGPGEFRGIASIVVAPGDTIHVFDHRNLRHTVLSIDGGITRSWRIRQYLNEATITSQGTVVLNQAIRTPERVGYPLHFINDGQVTRSFGRSHPGVRPDASNQFRRSLAPGRAGGVWAARSDQYLIEQFDAGGEFVTGLTRRMPLYQETGMGSARAPGTSTAAITVDATGYLWVLIVTPDPDWREAVTWGNHPDGPGRYTLEDYHGVYDTVIDVVDVPKGRVLASQRVDTYIQDFAGPDLLAYGYSVAADGTPQIMVWQLQLSQDEDDGWP